MNSCELAHFIYRDKPISKYELHWKHEYDSDKFFISEQDYHCLMDTYSENLLVSIITHKYNHKATVCMTITG